MQIRYEVRYTPEFELPEEAKAARDELQRRMIAEHGLTDLIWPKKVKIINRGPKAREKEIDYMNIKEMRVKHGFTQKGLSEYTGIPQRTIENWEGGKNSCPVYVGKLLEFFLENSKQPLDIPLDEWRNRDS